MSVHGAVGDAIARGFLIGLCGLVFSCHSDSVRSPDSVQEWSVQFSTDEATGMDVDVAPDGTTIAFEALGDIYTVPTKGGRAKLLVGGTSWDTYPRYSPDGRYVAFVSDRAGGSDLWTIALESGKASRITMPAQGTLGPPSWSPTGLWLYAGRVDETDVSAIWRFPAVGGMGEAVPLGGFVEGPVAAPDGQHLYYVRKRAQVARARVDGRYPTHITDATDHCGDQVRLSKHGTAIAYTCLEEKDVALYVHDLETDHRVLVYRSETPYPGRIALQHNAFAFVGDSHDLVVADHGRLRFVETAAPGGRANVDMPIPVERSVHFTIRNPERDEASGVPVPGSPILPMWPQISSDGRHAVAVVAGKLWISDRRNGSQRRLTSSEVSVLESSPRISADGCCVAFSVWDGGYSSIRTVDIHGHVESLVVRDSSSLFLHPSWSPEGDKIAAVRIPRSPTWSYRPMAFAIVEVDLRTGRVNDVFETKHARRHTRQFSGHPMYTGAGIAFVVHDNDESKVLLTRRDRPGVADVLFRTGPAEEIALSPSGLKAAVAANGATYVVDRTQGSAQYVDLGLQRKLSTHPGYFLSWHGADSLVSCVRALCKVRALSTGAVRTFAAPAPAGRNGGSDTSLVVRGGKVVTMGAMGTFDPGGIVMIGGRITYVGPLSDLPVPNGVTKTVEVPGTVIIPGLIDTHAHIGHWPPELVQQYSWVTRAYLRFGVTTIFDPQPAEVTIAALADLVRSNRMPGPDILSSGAPIFGERYRRVFPDMVAAIHSRLDAADAIERAAQLGTGPIKVYSQPKRVHRQWLAASAARRGLLIVGEGACDRRLALSMVLDGYTGFEHAIPGTIYADVRELLRQSAASYTPTVLVGCGSAGSLGWFASSMSDKEKAMAASVIPTDEFARRTSLGSDSLDAAFWVAARGAAHLAGYGVNVTTGSHGEMPGLGTIWEAVTLQMGGLAPSKVLEAATVNGARKLGISGDVGSLEVGKRANLVILEEDPTVDVRNLLSVVGVVRDGHWFGGGEQYESWPRRAGEGT